MPKINTKTLFSEKPSVDIEQILTNSKKIKGGKQKEDEEENEENEENEDNEDNEEIDNKEDDEAEIASLQSEKDTDDEDEDNKSQTNIEKDDNKSIDSDNNSDDSVDDEKKCYSKYAHDEDFDFDEYFKDDDVIINKTGRVGKPILFKYERVRLLSDRSRQLAEGAKPMIKNTAGLSHKEIALLELKNKLIPLIIERPIPNSMPERWKLSELFIPNYD